MRTGSEQPTAQQLLDYFNEKVASVRNSTGNSEPTTVLLPATAVLDQFDEYSTEDVRDVIVSGSTKSQSHSVHSIQYQLSPLNCSFWSCYHT